MTYVVQWYGYVPADDTLEPPEHILKHSITLNWRVVQKKAHDEANMKVYDQ